MIAFSNLGQQFQPFQFGVAVGLPTMIGVGVRRGVGSGVKAGRGLVAVGRGTGGVVAVVAGVAVAVAVTAPVGLATGVAVATVAGASGVTCPLSKMRETFSRLISNSMLPFAGGVGGATCLPLSVI